MTEVENKKLVQVLQIRDVGSWRGVKCGKDEVGL
jgi:hypothetical protein